MDPDEFTQQLKAKRKRSEAARAEDRVRAAEAKERSERETLDRGARTLDDLAARTAVALLDSDEGSKAHVFSVHGEKYQRRLGPIEWIRDQLGVKQTLLDEWRYPPPTDMAGWVLDQREYRGTRRSGTGWSSDPEEYTGITALVLLADGRLAIGGAPEAGGVQPWVEPRSGEDLLQHRDWGVRARAAVERFAASHGVDERP